MKSDGRPSLIVPSIILASLCVGVTVGLTTSQVGAALICSLLSCLILISGYSILAWLLGWPQPKWSDIWAIGYLLP